MYGNNACGNVFSDVFLIFAPVEAAVKCVFEKCLLVRFHSRKNLKLMSFSRLFLRDNCTSIFVTKIYCIS